jgi:hypothetical protein
MKIRESCLRNGVLFGLFFAGLLLCSLPSAFAQSGGPYQITQSVLPGGGGAIVGGTLRVEGTIGQGLAGTGGSGGPFTLSSGFPAADLPAAAAASISGQVIFNGAGLANVTLTLSGTASATTLTDSSGNYSFANLSSGNYTATPTKTNFVFTPDHRDLVLGGVNQTADFTASSSAVASGANGTVLISEFRLQGPVPAVAQPGNANGELDEFIELYNNSDSSTDISGFKLDTSAGFQIAVPQDTVIPARGHFLIANSGGYSLSGYATPDLTYSGFDLPPDAGLALLNSSNQIVDAVGFTTSPTPYREGVGITPVIGGAEYSLVRLLVSAHPQDSGNNRADLLLVSTDAGQLGRPSFTPGPDGPSVLGAPGPEGTAGPLLGLASIPSSLIEPAQAVTNPPNRVRDLTPNVCNGGAAPSNCTKGTFSVRRRFTNLSGKTVTRLRFRVIDVTTLNAEGYLPGGGQADLRLLSAPGVTIPSTSIGVTTLAPIALDQPPGQPLGGGLNTTVTVSLPAGGLPNGASVDLQFLLGVQQGGGFRFYVIVEGQ